MLDIENVNHIGIRIKDKSRSVEFYELIGFKFNGDVGFEEGHPIIMKHPSGVTLNLLGPANIEEENNILMDNPDKYTGITQMALSVRSLEDAKIFLKQNNISITGSFSFGSMSAIFIRDPDRNVIELDAYGPGEKNNMSEYSGHP